MGDTANGTWTSKELGAFIDKERRKPAKQALADWAATIGTHAASDFADEIAHLNIFKNAAPSHQAIAQMFFILGYEKGSLATAMLINKMIDEKLKEKGHE